MGDTILYIVVIVALTSVWIEWLPRKYDILIGLPVSIIIIGMGLGWIPNWHGWVITVLGVADLAWQYKKGVREFGWPHFFDLSKSVARAVQASLSSIMSFFSRERKQVTHTPVDEKVVAPALPQPRIPRRVWMGGIALTAFSPITAIPATILLAIVLTIVDLMLADAESLVFSFTQMTKSVFGNAFLIEVVTLDLVIRGFLITGPLFLLAGVSGAKWADRTGCYWQRLLAAGVLVGALYPAIFIVANTMGWFDEPFFT